MAIMATCNYDLPSPPNGSATIKTSATPSCLYRTGDPVIIDVLYPFCIGKACPRFAHRLPPGFVQTNYWVNKIVSLLIHLEYFFHLTHELGRALRDRPTLNPSGLDLVFLSLFRTVSRPMVSTYCNSTICWASNRTVQRT